MKVSLIYRLAHKITQRIESHVQAFSFQRTTTIATKLDGNYDEDGHTIVRRSANYQPPTWQFDHIQSYKSTFVGERYIEKVNQLKEQVSIMIHEKKESLDQLELIDDLQRLGLSYHYETQIKQILTTIYNKSCSHDLRPHDYEDNLNVRALHFRLLRQHLFNVSQDIFDYSLIDDGDIKPSLNKNIKALLNMYEASFMSMEGEEKMKLLMKFSIKHLKKNLNDEKLDKDMGVLVKHALELPLHWRMPWLEARWFIDVYERKVNKNSILLEFSKLNFNILQEQHLQDLKYMSRWWKETRLAEELGFARDRLVENFFWTVGLMFEPQYSYNRIIITKVNSLITTIDDIYDVYGTLDELELFTDVVDRWDTNFIEQLPEYMKVCFLVLYNNINDFAYEKAGKGHEAEAQTIISYLRKGWGDLCKSYLQEARWYFNGYTPTLEEYLNNAWISISAPAILVHVYFLVTSPPFEEKWLHNYHDLIRCSSMILRLADDLGTSSEEIKRGDVPKSIQCYMKEADVSEEKAREHIQILIGEIWKKMNQLDGVAKSDRSSQTFTRIAKNLARMAQCMYEHGDGHGHQNVETHNRIYKLIFEPIPLE